MSDFRFIAAVVVGLAVQSQGVLADTLPAEIPPASFTGNQYVDSKGCVFIRAGLAGSVNWVPRVNRDRQQLCGFEPSIGGRVASPLPANVPIIGVSEPTTTVAAAAPAVVAPAATRDPIQIVASIGVSPRVVAPAPAPVVATPQVTRPEPRRVTLAEICQGQSGILAGYVNAANGQPINCGPARPVTVASVAPTMVPSVGASACPSIGQAYLTGGAGMTVRCGPQAQTISRYSNRVPASNPVAVNTTAASGVSTTTYVPRQPAMAAPVVSVPTVTVPAPAVRSSGCNFDSVSAQYTGGAGVRCTPQQQSPSASRYVTGSVGVDATRATSIVTGSGLFGPVVPASNPVGVSSVGPYSPPEGYIGAWSDGRLNPQRGLTGY
ncbi:MAG: hypothetical protein EBY40_03610 [Marivivens sp.]|uniref:hypothetical protein n=1 Tax=Marivivens sp. TaxID=1978374 RepID=UPI00201EE0A0|nr:hypothetical protein [Marivivens sp.]MCL7405403.1 hypothetical protein [Marivivens geojensis]NDH02201.1 hypothetical protein [Marivivens sp.]